MQNGLQRAIENMKQAHKRRARALQLRESGMTLQEVGAALGVTKQRAAAIIARAKQGAGK